MNKKNIIIGIVVIATIALVVYYFKYKKPKTDAANVAPPSVPAKPFDYVSPTTPTWTQNPTRTTSKPVNPPTEQLADPVVVSSVKLTEQTTKTR